MKFELPELTRCCFCMPLRRGIIVLAYIQFLTSAFAVGVYSYAVHLRLDRTFLVFKGSMHTTMDGEICLVIFLIDIVVCSLLIYGLHTETMKYIKFYYNYLIVTCLASLLAQVVEICTLYSPSLYVFVLDIFVCGTLTVFMQLYSIILLKSYLTKLQRKGSHHYENPLNQFVTCEDGK